MIKIAITGNIASGKSEVEKILTQQGFSVLDTDEAAHRALENNAEVISAFSGFDITDGGKISHEKLGAIVFKDEKLRKKLEQIIHPRVFEEVSRFLTLHNAEQIVFVSVPLLFEIEAQKLFDKVVLVYADDDIRLERLKKRNNLTDDEALLRLSAQIPQSDKLTKSDFVIYNNGTKEDLKRQITEIA